MVCRLGDRIKDTAADMWDGTGYQGFSDARLRWCRFYIRHRGQKMVLRLNLWKGIKSTISPIADSIKDAIRSRFDG